jgi:hypothetical protein
VPTRTTSRKSRTSRTHTTIKKTPPDPTRLWELSTRWHSTVRGMLQGIIDSANDIEDALKDADHPLSNIFSAADFPDFTKGLEITICALVNVNPPAQCPVEIPDPLAICDC